MSAGNTLKLKEDIPVRKEYDVIVIGGGVAGVAAAVTAARSGALTLLVEKTVSLGGLATIGYITLYLPLCDGLGTKLIGGVAEELLHLSIKDSYHTLPPEWMGPNAGGRGTARYQTEFNGPAFLLQLDQFVLDNGVDLMLDTQFTSAVSENGYCTHIIVENQDGRSAYRCGSVVDATGDAKVFASLGAPLKQGVNYLSPWCYAIDLQAAEEAARCKDVSKAVKLAMPGSDSLGNGNPAGQRPLTGATANDVNEYLINGRALLRDMLTRSDPKQFAFTGLPSMPQFRTVRMIEGISAVSFGRQGGYTEDSIGSCGDWRTPGVVFEVPYGALITHTVKNVIAAGRIISCADPQAWEVTRVIPVAAMTGEAAGKAAALCEGKEFQSLDVGLLQRHMASAGTLVHLPHNA
ncbi:MAG TPA: FAD-dependent oxidoreductase [Feifaniaceae bacterium]|nr:FAD-dependent oxidoreductase [Feifaniaceae bacterium]